MYIDSVYSTDKEAKCVCCEVRIKKGQMRVKFLGSGYMEYPHIAHVKCFKRMLKEINHRFEKLLKEETAYEKAEAKR